MSITDDISSAIGALNRIKPEPPPNENRVVNIGGGIEALPWYSDETIAYTNELLARHAENGGVTADEELRLREMILDDEARLAK